MFTPKGTDWKAKCGLCGLLFILKRKKVQGIVKKAGKTRGDCWQSTTTFEKSGLLLRQKAS
jgi:hypothetical protein